MTDRIRVDIWSDVQCPWCYIGKRRFEEAVAASGVDVDVTYRSFELAPDTPVDYEGTPAQFLAERKGMPAAQVGQMLARVTQIAASAGLTYDFDRMHQTNTIKAHELLHLAKAHGRQLEMKEALLRAYFTDGGHVGRVTDLAELAVGVGLDRDEVVAALETGAYRAAVADDVAQAQALGISGVPFFVLDGRYGISGAQEVAVFVRALELARSERSASERSASERSASERSGSAQDDSAQDDSERDREGAA